MIAWLACHPRVKFHFTPTSRLRRGTFLGVVDLQASINRYVAEHNADPKPKT